jgi:uncharacterized protein
MRTTSDDTPSAVIEDRDGAGHGPERKCIVTGAHGERASLIRLAVGPDGAVWPDLAAKLPGRGAWIVADRIVLEAAMAKGKLKAALARAFRQPVEVPADLADRIAAGLERRCLDRLGLEHRAGHLIFGADKLNEWARAGRVHLLLHAADAAEDGVGKLNQAFRAGEGQMQAVIQLPAGRDALSRALGRENMVHSGVTDGKAAARIATEVARWAAFLGTSGMMGDGRADPDRRAD